MPSEMRPKKIDPVSELKERLLDMYIKRRGMDIDVDLGLEELIKLVREQERKEK